MEVHVRVCILDVLPFIATVAVVAYYRDLHEYSTDHLTLAQPLNFIDGLAEFVAMSIDCLPSVFPTVLSFAFVFILVLGFAAVAHG